MTCVALLFGAGMGACGGASADEAAAAAELRAQGVAYEHGEGVQKDSVMAAALYCQAGLAGDAEALYNLGWMYANGRGMDRNDDIAFALFARAARLGDRQALKMLAFLTGSGDRIPDCLKPPPPPPPVEAPAVVAEEPVELDPFADLSAPKRRIADMVEKVAPGFGIEPRLALAVIAVESNFEVGARSNKDARGLMQLIPETATRFNVRDAYDARQNVRGGLAYLRWLLAYYKGHVALAAAAYNAGEGAVDRYGGIPPFPETRDYVRRILALFRSDEHPFDPKVVGPSPIVAPRATR